MGLFKKSFFQRHPWARWTLAISFFILGVLGCFLPLAPGIPFLLAAAYLTNPLWFVSLRLKLSSFIKKVKKLFKR